MDNLYRSQWLFGNGLCVGQRLAGCHAQAMWGEGEFFLCSGLVSVRSPAWHVSNGSRLGKGASCMVVETQRGP